MPKKDIRERACARRLAKLTRLTSSRYWLPGWYLFLSLAAAASYYTVRAVMIDQRTWFYVVKSNITFNFLLFLFLYGLLSDKLTKRMSRQKGWVVWGIGLLLILLFFRFVGGYETILG